MALREILKKIQGEMAEQMPEEIVQAFGQNLNGLIEQKIDKNSLTIGDQAPDIDVLDTDGKAIKLYDLLKDGPVIINFFRGNWCPFCMAELADYQESIQQVHLPATQFLFISPQMQAYS
ncbi:MAG: redoxin domain-containing protein, partial [Wohlfahrtiimonas sp.]